MAIVVRYCAVSGSPGGSEFSRLDPHNEEAQVHWVAVMSTICCGGGVLLENVHSVIFGWHTPLIFFL
jgi:hypothetical protein